MYAELLNHFESHDTPLRVPRRRPFVVDDDEFHTNAYWRDPEGYALLALTPGVVPAQRARVLLQVLESSWSGYPSRLRNTLTRVVRSLVNALPGATVATVFLALRRRRANHKHVTKATLHLLTEHPEIDDLVHSHRAVLVDCLEHAWGKATTRGLARRLASDASVPAGVDARLALRIRQLYAGADRPEIEPRELIDLDGVEGRPNVVNTTNRGDIAATLVHLYRGGDAKHLTDALHQYVATVAAALPTYPGKIALVLDRSASMRGYGEREWAVLSQAEALRLVLAKSCEELVVIPVGATEPDDQTSPPVPNGATDLATAVLDAVSHKPDIIAVVSDGFENVYPGDLSKVVETLPFVDVETPVVFCHSAFGHSDDLTARRPLPSVPQRAFWHQADLVPLVTWLVAHANGTSVDAWIRQALRMRLSAVEPPLAVSAR